MAVCSRNKGTALFVPRMWNIKGLSLTFLLVLLFQYLPDHLLIFLLHILRPDDPDPAAELKHPGEKGIAGDHPDDGSEVPVVRWACRNLTPEAVQQVDHVPVWWMGAARCSVYLIYRIAVTNRKSFISTVLAVSSVECSSV